MNFRRAGIQDGPLSGPFGRKRRRVASPFAGATALYGLVPGIAGSKPCVRVEAASGANAGQKLDLTAAQITDGTLLAWCDGGDGFAEWLDLSGAGNHALAITGYSRPRLVFGGVIQTHPGNGLPALLMLNGTLASSAEFTAVALTASVLGYRTASRESWIGARRGALPWRAFSIGSWQDANCNAALVVGDDVSDQLLVRANGPIGSINSYVYAPATQTVRSNGNEVLASYASASTAPYAIEIGGYQLGYNPTQGYLQCIVMAPAVLDPVPWETAIAAAHS